MSNIISAAQFTEILKSGEKPQVLDVRTSLEWREVHMKCGCLHMPVDDLDIDSLQKMGDGTDKPIYILCRSGKRAQKAAEMLKDAGIDRAIVVDGGITACAELGADVVRDHGVLPIERQVQIMAGSLVILGMVLASLLHPIFYVLSAAIGVGLVFAGITGWCGGAILLAKAPWNR